eukprot:gnl/Dysnectes_brevis/6734_a10673_200.p1 GENE.gnl/Dysnectes_brevis/6734_a10673_200~~gnl/Dysnectes_brevis/6734_a10673_200.p1  ORF type:complete len:490 (-),score=119.46 gnl/Dysnectes_brevis/6734_a10673_200:38-1507(-)
MDPLFLSYSRLRRRKFKQTISGCNEMIRKNGRDESAFVLKLQTLIEENYFDETEMDEGDLDGIDGTADIPRLGTSLASTTAKRLGTGARPQSGFVRPVTASLTRPGGRRPGTATARAATAAGRLVRLGTASVEAAGQGGDLDVTRLNPLTYGSKPVFRMLVPEYLLTVEGNPRAALPFLGRQLAQRNGKHWHWAVNSRLARCYSRLGLLDEAENHLRGSLRRAPRVAQLLRLANIKLRRDQPNAALDVAAEAMALFPALADFPLLCGRVAEMSGRPDRAAHYFSEVLKLDPSCTEALACLAAHSLYQDAPTSLRLYRRLLLMDPTDPALWGNLACCLLRAQKHGPALGCLERALSCLRAAGLPEGERAVIESDLWFNMSCVFGELSDMRTARQCLELCLAHQPDHGEALTNLGVLSASTGQLRQALGYYGQAIASDPGLLPPRRNRALLLLQLGRVEDACRDVRAALALSPCDSLVDLHRSILSKLRQD